MRKNKTKGKLIVFYGINNLGKTTQAKMLVDFLNKKNLLSEYLKYPVYDLKPSGKYINEILRGGKDQKISEEELQMWYTINRFQYELLLKKKLSQGKIIIAEDYIGTGLAWGMAKKADLKWLEEINSKLLKEDLGILFNGERFIAGKESKHIHEQNDDLMSRSRKTHLQLAKKYCWSIIDANQSVEKVHKNILKIISEKLKLF